MKESKGEKLMRYLVYVVCTVTLIGLLESLYSIPRAILYIPIVILLFIILVEFIYRFILGEPKDD